MPSVRAVNRLIHKYEERLEGIQRMAELEEAQRYGTACPTAEAPETIGTELSICLDALRMYRDKLVEDQQARKNRDSEGVTLYHGS